MGSCFSCGESQPFDCVRVIHINGYVEDFYGSPVTAGDVTGRAKPPRHVLCTSARILSASAGPGPFRPEDALEPGRVYFLLPHAALLSSESSPLDLACLLNRLTALARRAGPARPPGPPIQTPSPPPCGGGAPAAGKRPPAWRPQLDRIDERSFGRSRDSMRSTCSST